MIEAHYHACKAQEYDKAANIVFGLHSNLFNSGKYRTLVDLYTGILPKDHFGDEILLSSKQTHLRVLEQLGLSYRAIGQLRKTIEYYNKALQVSKEINDPSIESKLNMLIADAYSVLGEHEKALEYFNKIWGVV